MMKLRQYIVLKFIVMLLLAGCTSSQQVYGQSVTGDSLYVKEAVLAKNVVEREPVQVVQSYDINDEVAWCFTRIYNNTGSLQTITFKWFYQDELYYEMDSKVGASANWRTYSSVSLQQGSWRVEIVGPNGETMKEIRFNVSG